MALGLSTDYMNQAQQNVAHYFAQREKLDLERNKFLSDPTLIEKSLAHLARESVPMKKQEKLPVGSNLAKTEAMIPDSDPRKSLASKLMPQVQKDITNNPDKHPFEVIANSYNKASLEKRPEIFASIFDQESSLFGSSDMPHPPGYDEWKTARMAEHVKDNEFNLGKSAAIGAAFGAGGKILQPVAASVAKKMAPGLIAKALGWMAGGAVAGVAAPLVAVAGAAVMGAAEFAAWDLATTPLRKSEWAASNPIKSILAEMAIGVPIMKGMSKIADFATVKNPALGEFLGRSKIANEELAKRLAELSKNQSAVNVIAAKDAERKSASGIEDLIKWMDESTGGPRGGGGIGGGTHDVSDPSGANLLLNFMKSEAGEELDTITKSTGSVLTEFEKNLTGFPTATSAVATPGKTSKKLKLATPDKKEITNAVQGLISQGASAEDAIKNVVGNIQLVKKSGEIDLSNMRKLGKIADEDYELAKTLIDKNKIVDPDVLLSEITSVKNSLRANPNIPKFTPYDQKSADTIIEKIATVNTAHEPIQIKMTEVADNHVLENILKEDTTKLDATASNKKGISLTERSDFTTEEIQAADREIEREILEKSKKSKKGSKVEGTTVDESDLKAQSIRDKFNETGTISQEDFDFLRGRFPKGQKGLVSSPEEMAQTGTLFKKDISAAHTNKMAQYERIRNGTTEDEIIEDLISDFGLGDLEKSATEPITKETLDVLKKSVGLKDEVGDMTVLTPTGDLTQVAFDPEARRKIIVKAMKARNKAKAKGAAAKVEVDEGAQGATDKGLDDIAEKLKSGGFESDADYEDAVSKFLGGGGSGGYYDLALLATATAASLVSVGSLFSSDAEAAGFTGAVTNPVVARTVLEAGEKAGKSTLDTVKGMLEKGYIMTPLKPGQLEIDQFMSSPTVTPSLANINMVSANKLHKILSSIGDTFTYGRLLYREDKMSHPVIDAAGKTQAAQMNTIRQLQIYDNIMSKFGIPDNSKEILAATKDLANAYQPLRYRAGAHALEADTTKRHIEVLEKALKKAEGPERDYIAEQIQIFSDKQIEHTSILKDLQGQLDSLKENVRDPLMKELAEKYPEARIFLHQNGEGVGSWLDPLMKENELQASGHIRKMKDYIGARMEANGMDVIKSMPYEHWAAHPSVDFKALRKEVDGVVSFSAKGFPLAKALERSIGGFATVPSSRYSMHDYLPDINRRIQMADFWRVGRKDGWAAHSTMVESMGLKGGMEFWDMMRDSLRPLETTKIDKAARIYGALEGALRLAFSPSVALKHLMKLEAPMSQFGLGETIKLYPQTFSLHARNIAADMYKTATGNSPERSLLDSAAESFVKVNRMSSMLSDLDINAPKTWTEGLLNKINDFGSFMVANTERFDRGHSFLAAMDMAAKKGMTAEQAIYGVYDTILKNNFLGGSFNPTWLRDPKVRLLTMFQGTPFKILENRVMMAMRGGKGVTDSTQLLWDKLMSLKKDIKEGEANFKVGMYKDALFGNPERLSEIESMLNGNKFIHPDEKKKLLAEANLLRNKTDVWGNSYSGQLARKIIILGTMLTGGSMLFDTDLSEHFLHVPGIKKEGGRVGLNFSPVITAALETKTINDDDYWISSFLQKWLPSGPIPGVFHKAMRIGEGDIPEMYRDSKMRYLFRLPYVKEQ